MAGEPRLGNFSWNPQESDKVPNPMCAPCLPFSVHPEDEVTGNSADLESAELESADIEFVELESAEPASAELEHDELQSAKLDST